MREFVVRLLSITILSAIFWLIGYLIIGRWPEGYESFALTLIAAAWIAD